MRKWIAVSFALVIIVALVACGGRQASLVGRWEVTRYPNSRTQQLIDSGQASIYFEFFRDGRLSITEEDSFETDIEWWNWSSDSSGTMRMWWRENDASDYSYQISAGSQLILTDHRGNALHLRRLR